MISLISNWPLKAGCPPELQATLQQLAQKVQAAEPDTLMYIVNLEQLSPLGKDGKPLPEPPPPIPLSAQKIVIFEEMYRDAEAFSQHFLGEVFQTFLAENAQYFITNAPTQSTQRKNTPFLVPQSGFIRPEVLDALNP